MNLYINVSDATHILPRKDGFGLEINPNDVFDATQTTLNVSNFPCFKLFDVANLKNLESALLIRDYALGDLIQLIPVARQFKKDRNIKDIIIATSSRFVNSLRELFSDFKFVENSHRVKNYGPKIQFNSILEKDHSLNNEDRNIHRVAIYQQHLGLKEINAIDWKPSMKNTRSLFFSEGDNVIALQMRGSGKLKTLPLEFVHLLAKEIAAMGLKVLLIDQDSSIGFSGTNIINACGKMDVISIVQNLQKCKCVLTMDSGVLWLAHVANCPVITFLGPTREHERVALHPQYPKKAKTIDLAKHVGCRPCFETQANCKGAINCMNKFKYDTIINEVKTNLNLILER